MEYRLNKYISGSGYCSRREADQLIKDGHVTLDGRRATIGMRVLPGQKVKVHGELITRAIEPVYIAFNKPVGVVSTTDPQEKNNIVSYISHEQRIFPIGRLDKDSQGLILLTNDGDIVNKILRVGNCHKKEYIVRVHKPITPVFLTRMAQGVPILDRVTRRCEIEQINPYTFKISLIQGLNRQIRRMCEYFDYEVVKLERIRIMNIKLGNLGQGSYRDLTPVELNELFDLLEASKAETQARRPSHSNKAMNKALKGLDLQTDHRRATSVNRQPKKSRSGRPSGGAFSRPVGLEGGKAKPVSRSEANSPRKNRSQEPSGKTGPTRGGRSARRRGA